VFDAWVVTTGTLRQAAVNARRETRQGEGHRRRVSVRVLPAVFIASSSVLAKVLLYYFKPDNEGVKVFPVCMILIWACPDVDDAV